MTNPNYRHIVIIADRSGSMADKATATEAGLSALLKQMADEEIHTTASLYDFDDRFGVVYERVSAIDVPKYKLIARGSTALNDAVGKTITMTGEHLAALPEDERPGVVIVVIATDGLENSSREYTTDQVREMITHQEQTYSWRFVFIGADYDAVGQAQSYGIPQSRSLAYSSAATCDSYQATSGLVSRLTTNSGAGYTIADRAVALGEDEAA
jgi:uncharacterized protein YegL